MAGTTYAPIMAILMVFEMSLDYEIILPLMLSVHHQQHCRAAISSGFDLHGKAPQERNPV